MPIEELKSRSSRYPGVPSQKAVNGMEVSEMEAKGPAENDNTVKGTTNPLVSRPEHAIFGLAMLGGGRVFGAAHVYGADD